MMRTLLHRWIKTNSVLLDNAGSLVGTTVVTSVLGFAYWWVAARQFLPEAVGLASAAVSTMLLLGTVGMLGLGTLLIGELPRRPGKEGSLISAALILVGGVGGCVGIVFAVLARYVSPDFQELSASTGTVALFALGVSLTAIVLVLDQALIGLLQGRLQLWRNTIFAGVKLAVLFVAGFWLLYKGGLTIYATWMIGNAVSLVVLAGFAVLKGRKYRRTYLPQWGLLRKLGSTALLHHVLNLMLQVPSLALPVLVTVLLSATANAWFYVSWRIVAFVFVVPFALTMVLYATSSAQPVALAHRARLTIGLSLVISVVTSCAVLLGAKQVLDLFGHTYAEQASWCLRILVLGSFPLIVKNHYVAVCRIQDRLAGAVIPIAIGAILELGMAALGARLGGLSGVSLGWLAGGCVEAMFMFPAVYKAVRFIDVSTDRDQLKQYPSQHGSTHVVSTHLKESGIGE